LEEGVQVVTSAIGTPIEGLKLLLRNPSKMQSEVR